MDNGRTRDFDRTNAVRIAAHAVIATAMAAVMTRLTPEHAIDFKHHDDLRIRWIAVCQEAAGNRNLIAVGRTLRPIVRFIPRGAEC